MNVSRTLRYSVLGFSRILAADVPSSFTTPHGKNGRFTGRALAMNWIFEMYELGM